MEDPRLKNFEAFANHPWLARSYVRLKKSGLEIAHKFLLQNAHLNKGDFELATNRMFLDKQRPKHYQEIQELLSCANSCIK